MLSKIDTIPAGFSVAGFVDASGDAQPASPSAPLPVTLSSRAGGVTWGAPTEVTATGSSQTLVAANASRKALAVWNPVGNSQMSIDRSGGTVTLVAGQPLLGGDRVEFSGDECPVGAVTMIGTAGQKLVYQQGT